MYNIYIFFFVFLGYMRKHHNVLHCHNDALQSDDITTRTSFYFC